MNTHENTGLARGHEVASIESEWRRIYGSTAEGAADLKQRTGRSDPRRLTRVEARLYLDVLRTQPTLPARPPMTDDELAFRVRRMG